MHIDEGETGTREYSGPHVLRTYKGYRRRFEDSNLTSVVEFSPQSSLGDIVLAAIINLAHIMIDVSLQGCIESALCVPINYSR